jgi:quercetin dioxygenase-like cupin family protein
MSKVSEAEFVLAMEMNGFAVTPVQFEAGTVFGDHAHDFESHILLTRGVLTITAAGVRSTLTTGDTYQLAANAVHHEVVGDEGVGYLSARPRQ